MRVPYSRTDRLLVACILLFLVNLVFVLAIEWQVQGRNERLDRFEVAIKEIRTATQTLETTTNDIHDIANQAVTPDPEMQQRLATVFQQVEDIHRLLVSQE